MEIGSASPPKTHSSPNSEDDQERQVTILLLEGETDLRKIISLTLHQRGLRVFQTSDPKKAQWILEKVTPDLFILDLDKQDGTNGELIDLYRQKNEEEAPTAVLLMTARRPSDVWRKRYRPDVVVYKPFDIRFLVRRVADLIEEEMTSIQKNP